MMNIVARFDEPSGTLTYVVYDERSADAVVIDPVLDYDPLASRTSVRSASALLQWLRARKLKVHYLLETHAHADHLTAAQFLRAELGAPIVIGRHISKVQRTFGELLDLDEDFSVDGQQFDVLVADQQRLHAGTLEVGVLHTPGHTPSCVTYQIGDAVFTGDALLMHDYGTGRCDFPGGDANDLYTSVHDRLYALPDSTRVFVGHDYRPSGRPLRYETTIGRSRAENPHLRADTSRADFVRLRTERDATLAAPRLLYPSVQVNINGGRLPKPHANGRRYLRVPIDVEEVSS